MTIDEMPRPRDTQKLSVLVDFYFRELKSFASY